MLTNENLFFILPILIDFTWFLDSEFIYGLKWLKKIIENEEYNEVPQLKASTF